MRTFYQILGVSNHATQKEIINAYRKKVVENHPDKGGDAIEFMNIRKAYETLSNPDVRAQYDQWLIHKTSEGKRQNWLIFMQSFVTTICNDEQLILLINNYLVSDNNVDIYKNLSSTPTSEIAAGLVKECLNKIRNSHPELFKQCIELDSVCNNIILGKFSYVYENKKEHTASHGEQNHKDIPEASGYSLKLPIAIVAIFIIIGVLMILNAPKDTDNRANLKNDIIYNDDTAMTSLPINSSTNDVESSLNDYSNIETNFEHAETNNNGRGDLEISEHNQYYEEITLCTGDVPYANYFGKGKFDKESLSELTITNYSSTDAVVLLETLKGDVIRNNFIKTGSVFTMKQIPSYSCTVKIMFGNSWNPEKDNGRNFPMGGFMKNVSFAEARDPFFFNAMIEKECIKYPTYSITLHKVKNGNMQTNKISQKDFFKK